MNHSDALRHVAVAILALILGACASYDSRLNDRNTVYLGTGGPVIDPSVKEDLALKRSYWDDSGIIGPPSIVINLTKQTASFYKGGNSSVSRPSPADAKASIPPPATSKLRRRISTTPRTFTATMSTPVEMPSSKTSTSRRIRVPPGRPSAVHPCLTSCASPEESECTKASSRASPIATAASGCQRKWPDCSGTTPR